MGALAMALVSAPAELALAQAAWDMFYDSALAECDDPNPDLRHDRALDRTIRALGRRPRAPLTSEEREALFVQKEVRNLIASASRVRNFGQRDSKEGKWSESSCHILRA